MTQQEERDSQLQSNGLTQGDMKKLQRKQILGQVETMEASNADDIKDKWFKEEYEGYQIPSVEDGLVHIALDMRSFAPGTGEKLSNSFVQIFDVRTFEKMQKEDAFKGMTSHILHYPSEEQQRPRSEREAEKKKGKGKGKGKELPQNDADTNTGESEEEDKE